MDEVVVEEEARVDMERVEEPLTTVRDRELASEAGVFDFDRDSRRNNRSHVRSGISLTSDMYTMDSSNMNPRHIRGSGSSLALTVGVADRLLEGVSVGRVKYTPWWTGRTWTSIPHTSNAASWSMMCHVNVGLRLSGVVTGRNGGTHTSPPPEALVSSTRYGKLAATISKVGWSR